MTFISVTSSIDTKALHQIDALKKRLRTQENAKLEVLINNAKIHQVLL